MPKHIGVTDGEFSVVIFFEDDSSHYVRAWVSDQEAAEMFREMTSLDRPINVMGLIERVIITDGMDCTAMVWEREKGVTFPTVEQLEAAGIDYDFESDQTDKPLSSH